jgi:peptide-methionine (R)-S-oxide reductase
LPGAVQFERDDALAYPCAKYHCVHCRGHHGQVFDDGPDPTGQRFCNNGVALRFIADAKD